MEYYRAEKSSVSSAPRGPRVYPQVIWLADKSSSEKTSEKQESCRCNQIYTSTVNGWVNISGLNIIWSKNLSLVRRLLWLLVILGSVTFMVYNLSIYFERIAKTKVERKFTQEISSNIVIPDISICHNSKYKKSVVKTMAKENTTLLNWYDSPEYSLLNWTRYDLDEFNDAAKYTWNDMVTSCMLGGSRCEDVGRVQESVFTQTLGACSTYSTNLTIHEAFMNGQIDIIFKEIENLTDLEHKGWRVVIHPTEVPLTDLTILFGAVKVVWVPANSSIMVKATKQIFDYISVVDNAGKPNCLSSFTPVMTTSCFTQCEYSRFNYTNQLCHLPWLPLLPGQQPCRSYADFSSVSQRDMDLGFTHQILYESLEHCSCPLPCDYATYALDTPNKLTLKEMTQLASQRIRFAGTAGHLNLWLCSVNQMITDVWPYRWPQLSSDLGGCIGLMIGGSILTFVELLDWLIFGFLARVFYHKSPNKGK